jgi:hypothetical protein
MTARSSTAPSVPTALTVSEPSRTSTAVKWWRTTAAARLGVPVAQASSR